MPMTVKDLVSLVENVENRQDQHDKRFDKIENILQDQHDKRFDKIENILQTLTDAIAKYNTRMDNMDEEIGQISRNTEKHSQSDPVFVSNVSPKSSSLTHPKDTKHHPSGLLPTPTGPIHIGQSSASSPIVDAYLDTYNAPEPIPSPRPTHHPRHIEPQDRQSHYQAPRHTYADDPVRNVKLNAPEFDGRFDPSTFLRWLD
ncbi:hypothetical protein TorRG33x02_311010 [Trema orientale]|uniref:Uncharacterized protein n=1 Tax=Trema orientale TaxID=63057 RepID=A0A2P5BRX1_TREOI|nr:hypothetical protein TorRG33x02_311010 [Trema orientale]